MKQIEEYVEKVYRHAKGNDKEVQELKIEMKNHLVETVYELKSEGFSEEEAMRIAKERFGEVNELRSQINQIVQTQKFFGKRILYIGLSLLLVSIALFGIILAANSGQESDQAIIAYEIADLVADTEVLSSADENQIQSLIQNAPYIKEVKAYSTGDLIVNHNAISSEPLYKIEREMWGPLTFLLNTYSYGTDDSFVVLEVTDYRIFAAMILFAGLASSGTLFAIRLIINVYHRKIE
ncbi:permease prefix domain 1-containing protein [Salinicoccus albus]|uniref:permease prefix domain 1-containing protein n=1 Tax=Salinicoccus albus TaxID=418756 RepID=UPI00037E940E|nr:permease prefix domain 1-containing protein [Salinicoccus albus]